MRLIKIGRSPSNDIVINSEFVGSHHADITILDSGEILIEDKGSKNGTFIGPDKRRIKPGEEVQIRRGDKVTIADTDLNWSKVPAISKNSQYKRIQNIGSNYRNDIVVTDDTVSRYHATAKVDQNNKVFVEDNGSTNGTEVNGVKIKAHQPVRIKRGDHIVVGSQDITPQLAPLFPKSKMWIPITLGCACLGAAIVFLILWLVQIHKTGDMKDAVAHVSHLYHYRISPKNNPYDLPLTFEEKESSISQGTAFFIDDKGRLGTCMHVVEPWREEFNPEKIKELKKDWADFLSSKLPRQVRTPEELAQLLSSDIGEYISQKGNSLAQVNAMLNTLFTSELEIEGITDDLLIGYPGRMYNKAAELDPASVVAKSNDANADVAIIQLNTKQTPEKALKSHFDLSKSYTHNPKPMSETFRTIGYPQGIVRALDFETLTMEPYIRESKVAKEPSKYYFELQDDNAGGASGSPVFNEKNELAGVVNAVFGGDAKTVYVIKAKYLKDLYDKEFSDNQ